MQSSYRTDPVVWADGLKMGTYINRKSASSHIIYLELPNYPKSKKLKRKTENEMLSPSRSPIANQYTVRHPILHQDKMYTALIHLA